MWGRGADLQPAYRDLKRALLAMIVLAVTNLLAVYAYVVEIPWYMDNLALTGVFRLILNVICLVLAYRGARALSQMAERAEIYAAMMKKQLVVRQAKRPQVECSCRRSA